MRRDTKNPKKKRGTINVPPSCCKYRYRYILLVHIRTNLLYLCSLVIINDIEDRIYILEMHVEYEKGYKDSQKEKGND